MARVVVVLLQSLRQKATPAPGGEGTGAAPGLMA
jgi:hypothetical protein